MPIAEQVKRNRIIVRVNTVEEEVEYIFDFMERMAKFKEFGYNLSLPNTFEIESIINKALKCKLLNYDKEIIHSEIAKVYNEIDYKEAFEKVMDKLDTIKKQFEIFEYYKLAWGFKIFDEYSIKITQFGPGGSYYHQNGEIIMKKSNCISRPAETIIHEIIHIGIEENIIEKYSIPHQFKERIVDKFILHHFKDIFPQYRVQKSGDDSIDKYLNYPDSWSNLSHYIKQFATEHLNLKFE